MYGKKRPFPSSHALVLFLTNPWILCNFKPAIKSLSCSLLTWNLLSWLIFSHSSYFLQLYSTSVSLKGFTIIENLSGYLQGWASHFIAITQQLVWKLVIRLIETWSFHFWKSHNSPYMFYDNWWYDQLLQTANNCLYSRITFQ